MSSMFKLLRSITVEKFTKVQLGFRQRTKKYIEVEIHVGNVKLFVMEFLSNL